MHFEIEIKVHFFYIQNAKNAIKSVKYAKYIVLFCQQ